MEWGYALLKQNAISPFNGSQNNTIKNCSITLNRANTNSVAIYVANHVPTSVTVLGTVLATDANSNNVFISNTIQNAYFGIKVIGISGGANDLNNQIGQTGFGNTIQNFCGAAVTGSGIYLEGQTGVLIKDNTINNIASGGVSGAAALSGIYLFDSHSGSISSNNITLQQSGNAFTTHGIQTNNSTSIGTIAILNNTIQCSYSANASGFLRYIYQQGTFNQAFINNNTFAGSTLNTSADISFIRTQGTNNFTIDGNSTSGAFNKSIAGGNFYPIMNNGSPTGGTAKITNNAISNISMTGLVIF